MTDKELKLFAAMTEAETEDYRRIKVENYDYIRRVDLMVSSGRLDGDEYLNELEMYKQVQEQYPFAVEAEQLLQERLLDSIE